MKDQYCCGHKLIWKNGYHLYSYCSVCGKHFIAIPTFYYNLKYKYKINL
jgi:hypothetical protein